MRPTAADVRSLTDLLRETERELKDVVLPEKLSVIAQRLENIAAVFAAYRQGYPDDDAPNGEELSAAEALLAHLREEVGGEDALNRVARNREGLNPSELERRAWQQGLELREVERIRLSLRTRVPREARSLSLRELLWLAARMLAALLRFPRQGVRG
jgi:hypothetical protein